MKSKSLLALFFLILLCACNALGRPRPASLTATSTALAKAPSTTTLIIPADIPSTPIAVYIPQPAETPTTPKWDNTQVSCKGRPFDQWGAPGTYLCQSGRGLFTIVLKPGETIPKLGVSIPERLSVAGIEGVTIGLGTFEATVLSGGGAYSILTGRLDSVRGTCHRSEWYVCGYGLVKLSSSDSGVKTPGNYSYSSSQDFGLVSFTPLTTNEAHVRYILADIQLGNVIDSYRANVADEETAEALRRWDAGMRVTNSAEFERRISGGRWHVVYAGTEKTANGTDIDLSGGPH